MKLTTSNPHPPRMLQAYSTLWSGPRPAIVVQAVDAGHANVNVLLDGTTDAQALAGVRQSPCGNTAAKVPVYEVEQVGEVPSPELHGAETPQLGKVVCVWPVPPARAGVAVHVAVQVPDHPHGRMPGDMPATVGQDAAVEQLATSAA